MFRTLLYIILLFAISIKTTAQKQVVIKGKLFDTLSHQSLEGASISVLQATDSTIKLLSLAKQQGVFELKNIPNGKYIIQIDFEGYQTKYKNITITPDNRLIDLGNIYMQFAFETLINVTARTAPFRLKKDTVEYNAGSFKTKTNAVVEDLLKELPGIQVNSDGVITANGEIVEKVLVDGKIFFGDDQKMVTKNLPSDIIDKVEIYKALSDQSKFTGIDDGNKSKTINLVIKKNKRKGNFGKIEIGAGSDQKYSENANLNHFNNNKQFSGIGQINNINNQNFTSSNQSSNNGNGRSGIITTSSIGANYRTPVSKNVELYGSYFYSSEQGVSTQKSLLQNLFSTDSSTFNDQNISSQSNNKSHRFNINLEDKIDSRNSLTFRSNINIQNSLMSSSQHSTLTKNNGDPIYNSSFADENKNEKYSFITSFLFNHNFKKRLRVYSINLNLFQNNSYTTGYNNSINQFFSALSIDTIGRHNASSVNSKTVSISVSYTEPINKNQVLGIVLKSKSDINKSDKNSFMADKLTGVYNVIDSIQSNSFQNTFNTENIELMYKLQLEKCNLNIGSALQVEYFSNKNVITNKKMQQSFTTLVPIANLIYNFSTTKNLQLSYNGTSHPPSIQQLQPTTSTNDSVNIWKGNPALKQSFMHNLFISFTSFNLGNEKYFSANINANFILNDIQNSITQLNNGVQITTPINLNGTSNISASCNFSLPLNSLKSTVSFNTNISYLKSSSLINNFINYNINKQFGETITVKTKINQNFIVNISAASNFNVVHYSLQPNQTPNYYSQIITAEISNYTKNGWAFSSNFSYTHTNNYQMGFNNNTPLLLASIAKSILKNKQCKLKLSVFDLLNQNKSISRVFTNNTIQDVNSNIIKRYVLLSCIYDFKYFKKK